MTIETNKIYCGDNLGLLSNKSIFPDESVDLVYIDPPFFSNKQYTIIFEDDIFQKRSFNDAWKGGINHYINWMRPRLRQIRRILKPTGSFYLHCDWHAGHYLKVMCDEIFGINNFENEIVWCYRCAGDPKKTLGKDTIQSLDIQKQMTIHSI